MDRAVYGFFGVINPLGALKDLSRAYKSAASGLWFTNYVGCQIVKLLRKCWEYNRYYLMGVESRTCRQMLVDCVLKTVELFSARVLSTSASQKWREKGMQIFDHSTTSRNFAGRKAEAAFVRLLVVSRFPAWIPGPVMIARWLCVWEPTVLCVKASELPSPFIKPTDLSWSNFICGFSNL